MKNKFLYIIFFFVVLFISSGFGFLESSTIMHGRENRQVKADSLKIAYKNVQLSANSPSIKREIEKPVDSQITKSVIQWIANFVKNVLQLVVGAIINIAKAIFITIIKFFVS